MKPIIESTPVEIPPQNAVIKGTNPTKPSPLAKGIAIKKRTIDKIIVKTTPQVKNPKVNLYLS